MERSREKVQRLARRAELTLKNGLKRAIITPGSRTYNNKWDLGNDRLADKSKRENLKHRTWALANHATNRVRVKSSDICRETRLQRKEGSQLQRRAEQG